MCCQSPRRLSETLVVFRNVISCIRLTQTITFKFRVNLRRLVFNLNMGWSSTLIQVRKLQKGVVVVFYVVPVSLVSRHFK